MKQLITTIVICIFLVACGGDKKIVVLSKGPAEINTDLKTIKAGEGAGHEEKEAMVSGDKIVFKLSTPAGEATVQLLQNGLYIVNVKNDTIIGSYQNYSAPHEQKVMTQDYLKKQIDSLQLLSEGKNVTPANRNFYILPNHAAWVTNNLQALIVGPYHKMTSAETVDGKSPEVYRFYSIKEIRETIEKLEVLANAPIEVLATPKKF
jgi:hypothetical protein